MKASFSPLVQERLREINKRDEKLFARIKKQVSLFEENANHPSLRRHKLTGKLSNRWSISAGKDLRMIYIVLENNVAYFVDLGTHDEVYRD